MLRRLLTFPETGVLMLFAFVGLSEARADSWTIAGSLNVVRINPETTILRDGRVLTATGRGGEAAFTAEVYDPRSATWVLVARTKASHDHGTATLLQDGRVLLAGGFTTAVELYDPETDSWSLTGPLNIDRADHTATLLLNGKVLVTGGLTFSDATDNSLECA